MKTRQRISNLDVYMELSGQNILVGTVFVTRGRGGVSSTFIYDPGYLSSSFPPVDPALPLLGGPQHQSGLIRAFADAAPDRWGRNLIEKIEKNRAASEGRMPRHLDDLDYLLGVSDITRQGALRFALAEVPRTDTRVSNPRFLAPGNKVPKLIALPELLAASDQIVSGEETSQALKQMLDTGTTGLGGARPKASVLLEDGSLGMVKFPHSGDQWDVMAWEATSLDLMAAAGLQVPVHRITKIGNRTAHILGRFDRQGANRLPYISMLTALESADGQGGDYLSMAGAVRELSANVESDLLELFDRVVFSVLLGNTDDHLRNHGFLGWPSEANRFVWRLSPVFDVNPNPRLSAHRATTIGGVDVFPDEAAALWYLAAECGLETGAAQLRIRRLLKSFDNWQATARRNGIPGAQISLMEQSLTQRRAAVQRLLEE